MVSVKAVAPVIVPAERKKPFTVEVLPVMVNVFVPISSLALASTTKLLLTVSAELAETVAAVFEMRNPLYPSAAGAVVMPGML
jgi:hypothetical protein